MATFPVLTTGAVAQYPLAKSSGYGVDVIRFVDGSDQRYRTTGNGLRRWAISLNQLSDTEMALLLEFFEEQQGAFSAFIFTDPFTGTDIPNCRLANPTIVATYLNTDFVSTALIVEESLA